ncbi:enediyne antibiotic chromoprotein [Amycolatopsis sp. PS_44_ISF1]|uniref:enediyne antibiotic chromoprotein n=1 Tax=Amycolatopsis sp. PS_44_ISF1 TaxID=2974917 RepID=UPI0028DED038|nr:enediyne antibiotic chromoprotein [Amycolatopsis sp. PS_44_ISF1]MDT8910071.1 enediyne antibiotic chromoprotein [Amycolatopsis sp. PS_44_ISF1]
MSTRSFTIGAKAVVAAGFALTLACSGTAPASAAAPALTASPSSGLTDGQVVAVSGTGYAAGSTIVLLECDAAQPAGRACDKADLVGTVAGADGTLAAKLTVHRAFQAVDLSTGAAGATVDCATAHCVIASADTSDTGTAGAGVSITFG